MLIAFVLVAVGAPLLPMATPADAEGLATTAAQLPTGRDGISAVWTGDKVVVFGGWDGGALRQVVHMNPDSEKVEVGGARFASGRFWTSAAWDGRHAYVFGGIEGDLSKLAEIVRYDPDADALTLMRGSLPSARGSTSAAWHDEAAYIFGGHTTGALFDDILRYDPAADRVDVMQARLPTPRDSTAAVSDGRYIYVFGGHLGNEIHTDEIVRYDPATDTVTVLPSRLPTTLRNMGAAWAGTSVFLFGGVVSAEQRSDDRIVRFFPASGEAEEVGIKLPSPRTNVAAVTDGARAWILGGRSSAEGNFLREILAFTPGRPGVPLNVLAVGGPEVGQITLTWDAPAFAEEDGVTRYRIYRAPAEASPALVAEVGLSPRRFVDTPPDPAMSYSYRVSALAPSGEGAWSPPTCTKAAPLHMAPSLEAPCSLPQGWRERVALDVRRVITLADEGVLATIEGAPAPDPRFYRVVVTVGESTVADFTAYTGGLVTAPVRVDVGLPVSSAGLHVRTILRYDPAAPVCLLQSGNTCLASSPIEPLATDWVLGKGPKAELVAQVVVEADHAPVARQYLRIPFAGQSASILPGN